MEDEQINKKGLMKSIQRLAGQAATAVQEDELQRQYERMRKLQAQQNMYPDWQTTTTTTAANTLGGLGQQATTAANMQQAYNQYATTQAPTWIAGGSGMSPTQWARTVEERTKSISFTDEQMSLFMEKLAHLLSKGWECIRCHRIWNPRETGCEFCNFIDRLEGKDVERDSAA